MCIRDSGLSGGQAGAPGEQYLAKRDGELIQLDSTAQESLETGDRLILKTPGGGGFGKPETR